MGVLRLAGGTAQATEDQHPVAWHEWGKRRRSGQGRCVRVTNVVDNVKSSVYHCV